MHRCTRLKHDQHLVPDGGSELDWGYKHVSNKLFMVLSAFLDTNLMKAIDESKEQCGFDFYRLLSWAHDPLNGGIEHVLLGHILALSSWSVKGLAQI